MILRRHLPTGCTRVSARLAVPLALLLAVLPVLFEASPAAAARAFALRYQANLNGDLKLYGAPLLTCSNATAATGRATCPAIQSGGGTTENNNGHTMANLQADTSPAASGLVNSSSVDVNLPAGAQVTFAGLYWQASGPAQGLPGNQLSFRPAGRSTYSTVTATTYDTDTGSGIFAGFVNITSTVQSAGNGTYWAGNLAAQLATNTFGGWAIVLVYSLPTLPTRNITVYDGLQITNATITLSGFLTPPNGPVNAAVGIVAGEGDAGTTGDTATFNGSRLSDAANPATNFFNSTISEDGALVTARNPAYQNTLGWDVDRVLANGYLANSQTSTTLVTASSGDAFYPQVVGTRIDLYAPVFPAVTKSVVDLDATSPGGPAKPGDRLRYTVTQSNTGLDPADGVVVNDVLPANVTYVPGSLQVTAGANTGTKTDAAGDDQGEYLAGTRTVRARLGSGANATTGGTLASSNSTTVTFVVTVDPAAAGTTIDNFYTMTYTARTLNQTATTTSNSASMAVADVADLSITKSATPNPIVAGADVTYTVTVTNAGPSTAAGTTVTDTLPTGVTLVSATPSQGTCTTGTTACALGAVAAGSSATVTYVVSTAASLAGGALLANSASTTTTTLEQSLANNSTTISTPVTTAADLVTTKTGPASAVPGQNVTWTATVTNAGPSIARAASLADTLPAGTTLVSATPSVGTCTTAVACSFGDLAVGAAASVTVVAKVASSATGTIANTAAASSNTADPVTTNNTATATSNLVPSANLSVSKSVASSPLVAGRPATWSYTITNGGPSDARTVTSTDSAPTGVTWTWATATLGSCTFTASTVSCAHSTIPAGGTVTVTVIGDVASGAAITATAISNTATASTTTTESSLADNSPSVTTPLVSQVQLEVGKTATPDPVPSGGGVTYTVTVRNVGPSDATGVTVSDPLPAHTTSAGSPTTSQGTCALTAGTVSCTLGTLALGATATVTIPVTVDSGFVGTAVANTASVASDQTTAQTATFTSTVTQQADVRVAKTGPAGPVIAGQTATWSYQVVNDGPSDATSVTLADTLPAGFTFVSSSAPQCSPGVGGGSVSCAWSSLTAGASVSFTVTTAIAPSAAAGPTPNTADVTAAVADPTTSNNASTGVADVRRSADLSMTKTGPATIPAGATASYTLGVANAGPSTATATTIVDVLPLGLTFDAATSDARCSASGRLVKCDLGTLASGANDAVVVGVRAASSLAAGATVTNTAQASTTTPDANGSNDSATTSAPVTVAADLAVTKSGPATVTAGRPATWTVTLTNAGPADAAGVTVSDPAPAGVTWTSVTSSSSLLTCTTAGTCSAGSGVTVPVGTSVTITLVGDLGSGVTGPTLANTATASATSTDPVGANNTATSTSAVVTAADLTVTKSTTGAALAGTAMTWTVTVVNNGPSIARTVTVADPAAAGVTWTAVTASSGSCTTATGGCSLGDLAVGATVTLGYTGSLAASIAPGSSLTNTASASSPTADPAPADNTASVTSTTTALTNVAVTKSAVTPSVRAGEVARWAFTVTNAGPSDALAVTADDPAPAGVDPATVAVVSTGAGTCAVSAGTVHCALGTIAAGAMVTVVVTGTVRSSVPHGSTVTNTVTVATTSPQTTSTDDSASANASVVALAGLSIVKTYTGTALTAGGSSPSWLLTVRNTGPSDATGVTVSDPLAATVTAVTATASRGACSGASTVTCSLGTVPAGGTATIALSGALSAAHVGPLSNTATVTTTTPDSTASDDSSTVTTPVATSADVAVTKQADGAIVAGSAASWTVTVTNNGPSVARSVSATDGAPAGVVWATATTSVGSCTLAVSCTFGDLAVGATATVHLTGTVSSTATGTATNTASATSATADPAPSNNAAGVTTPVTTTADLRTTKTLDAPLVAGQTGAWTVSVTNAGPSMARAVSLADPAPAGVSWTSITTTAGSCDSGAATCSLGDLAVGATVTVHLTGAVAAATTGNVTNTATASSPTTDPTPADATASVTSPVSTTADLSISKAADGAFVAGSSAHWTVTVVNNGPSVARAATVSDAADPAFTLTGLSTSVGTCSLGGASCSLGDLPPGATVTIGVDATIAATVVDGAAPTNTATVASGTTDSNGANNRATAATPVARVADLSVTKSAAGNPAPWTAGQGGRYTITVANAGPSASGAATITDTLPAGTAFSAFASTSPGLSCAVAGATVTCTFSGLAAGSSLTAAVDVAIASAASGTITNTATVSQTGATDPDPSDGSASASSPTATSADLTITKHPIGTVVAGTTHDWRIDVVDHGPSDATSVVVTDTLPAGLSWVAPPAGCTTVAASTIQCAIGTLAAGATASRQGTVLVDADLPAGTVTNHASVTAAAPDPAPADDSADVAVTVARQAKLIVTKTADASPAVAGTAASFTVTVANAGPSSATSVVVTDPLPAGLTFSASRSDARCSLVGGVVTCALGDLAVGTVETMTIGVDVAAGASGTLTNTAHASTADPLAPGSTVEATAPLAVTSLADLAVTKQADGPVVAGLPASWTVTVTNRGPSTARGVVADDAPLGVTWTAATASVGTCDLTAHCTLGDLAVGATATLHLTGTVDTAATGTVTNSVTASSATPDPAAANSTATAVSPVVTSADLAVVKTLDGPLVAGSPGSWTVTVTNLGPSVARAATLDDGAPGPVTWTAATVSAGACDLTAHCVLGDLAVGATVTAHLTGTVDAAQLTAIVNTATADAATADPSPSNSTASTTSAVASLADLAVTKVLDAPLTAGEAGSWTVTVTNAGPSVARAVHLADPEPLGVEWTSVTTGAGACDLVANCSLGDLAVGASVTVHLTGMVDPARIADVANTATATSATVDPNPTDNAAAVTSAVAAVADLVVAKSMVGAAVTGAPVTWRITVTNNGPSVAHGATLADPSPSGVTWTSTAATVGLCDTTVHCDLGDLAPGQQVTVSVTGTLDAGYTAATLANAASAASAATDPNGASATATSAVATVADLHLDKLPSAGPWTAGTAGHQWTLRLTNAGPSNAGPYTVSDALPAGVDLTAVTLPAGCTMAAATVTCTGADLAVGMSVEYPIGVTVLPSGASLVNTATVSAAASDPLPTDDVATSDPGLVRQVDLQVAKSGPAVVTAGEDGTWTVTVTNRGPSTYDPLIDGPLSLRDQLPAGFTAVSATASDPTLACSTSGALVTCAGPATVAPAGVVTMTVVGHADAAATAGPRTNVATANIPPPPGDADPAPSDNLASAPFVVVRRADLSATKSGPASVIAGTTATWTVSVTNGGPSTAESPTATDTLPTGLVYAGASGASCTATGTTVTCARGSDLAPASTWTFTIDTVVDAGIAEGTYVNAVHAASLTAGTTGDATAATTVSSVADLSVAKVAVGTFVAGGAVSWLVTVQNAGPSDASGVSISDDVPAGVDAPVTSGDGTCVVTGQHIDCAVGTLSAGASATFTITGVLDAAFGAATISNTATVSSATADQAPADHVATAVTAVSTSADLHLEKVADQATATAGGPASWTVTVANRGPSVATAVTVTDTLPAGTTLDSIVVAPGTGSCAGAACTFPTLAVGDVATLGVHATLDPALPAGTIVNTATVAATTTDPVPADDSASAAVTVDRHADLQVTKTGATTLVAGTSATWTITIHNDGPSTATAARIDDPAPAGVTFTSWSVPGGVTCTLPTGGTALACDLGTLAPGAITVVTVAGTLAATATPSTLLNAATATTTTPDPAAANSTGTASTAGSTSADLSVTKSGPAEVAAGGVATWQVVVTNHGPSAALAVEVTDIAPSALTLSSMTTPSGTCSGGRCTIGVLAVGASATVTVSGGIAPSAVGTLTNSATVSSAITPDPDAADNSASATSAVTIGAALVVAIAADAGSVTTGGTLGYHVSLVNNGPADAAGTVLTVAVPAGLTVDRTSLPPGAVLSADGRTITYEAGTVPVGSTVSFSYSVSATSTSAQPVATTTTVTATSPSAAISSSTVVAAADVPIRPLAALSVTKFADSAAASVGGSVLWTIAVTNAGPSPAATVVVHEQLPSALHATTAQVSVGAWDGAAATWSIPLLPVGEVATLHLTTSVSAPGALTNSVTVESATASATPSAQVASATVQAAAPVTALPRTGAELRRQLAVALALTALGAMLLLGRRPQTSH